MQRSIVQWDHEVAVATEAGAEAVQQNAAAPPADDDAADDDDVGLTGHRVVPGVSGREVATAYCRRCEAHWPVSAARLLSAHSTSAGVVTYFRCPDGHVNFE